MEVYVLVFEDNPLEMIDGNKIFKDHETAKIVRRNYQRIHDEQKTGRVVVIRAMHISQ